MIRNNLLRQISISYGGEGLSQTEIGLLKEISAANGVVSGKDTVNGVLLDILGALGGVSTSLQRNGILRDIVIAQGGVVTSGNRNGLLFNWLESASEPVKNYVYRLDGLTQYYQLSEALSIEADDDYELAIEVPKLEPSLNSNSSLIGGNRSGDSGSFATFIYGDSKKIGVQFPTETSIKYLNSESALKAGEAATIKIERTAGTMSLYINDIFERSITDDFSDFNVERFGSWGNILLYAGAVRGFSLKVNGAIIYEIPLTNKDQGATQLPTVGNVSATIVNYTDSWEEV